MPVARSVALAGLLWIATASVWAEDILPDRRAVAPSRKPVTTESTTRDAVFELLHQLEATQEEVKQLRNMVEVQGHELEQIKNRQNTLYDDLDKRLREAEKARAAAPVAATVLSAPVPVPGGEPAAAAQTPAPAATATAKQQQEYDAAFALMKQGMYSKASKSFREFLARHPESALADNAQYWIAECNYVLRNYKLALEEYTKVLNYPQGSKLPDAQLKIGFVHYELSAWDKARKALTEVQTRYPGTNYAKLATARLDKMKKEGH